MRAHGTQHRLALDNNAFTTKQHTLGTEHTDVVPPLFSKQVRSVMSERTPQALIRALALLLCWSSAALLTPSLLAAQPSLHQAWLALSENDYQQKREAIQTLTQEKAPQAQAALQAMLDGQLYYAKQDKSLFILKELQESYQFRSLLGDARIAQESKRGYARVKINNSLRGLIRQSLAILQLQDPQADVRLSAVQALLKRPDTDAATLIESLIHTEKNKHVIAAMQTLLAITQLRGGDEPTQAQAITLLSQRLNPAAFNALNTYQAPSPALQQQVDKAITHISRQRDFYAKIETVFFGLSLGSVLALSAIGLAITFGVMGVINMAHGELMMIGAYTTYVIQRLMPEHIGLSIIIAIPAAFITAALVGIAIERGVIRHLYGRPLETLLATFGISLLLQQSVRSIFSPLNRSVETPQWMSGAWQINEVLALTWNRLYIIFFCLAVFIALITVMQKTTLGLQVRAVSQNRDIARAMGVRSQWVDALTFGLGSGIAGIAGVGLSLLTNVGPNLGQAYIIDSFMVVVFGGVGSLWGTLAAGMGLGIFNKILEPWAGAVLSKILALVFIILFIQKYPKGLFVQRGRAAQD